MDNTTPTLFRKASSNPDTTLGQLVKYLRSVDQLPRSRIVDSLGTGVDGKSTPDPHEVLVSSSAQNPYRTYTHEMNHAALDAIGHRADRVDSLLANPAERRLKAAWEKIGRTKSKLPLGPNVDVAYRNDPHEYLSFGTGNYALGNIGNNLPENVGYPVAPHVDATAATESAILLDLANKAGKSRGFIRSLMDLF